MKTQQVAVSAFIIRPDESFLLTKRSPNNDFFPGLWEIPGGGSDYGETPEVATIREVQEECGITILVHQPVTTHVYYAGETQRIELMYFCSVDEAQQVTLSEEHTEFAWVTFDELEKYELDDFMKNLLKKFEEDYEYLTKKYIK